MQSIQIMIFVFNYESSVVVSMTKIYYHQPYDDDDDDEASFVWPPPVEGFRELT